MEGWSFSICKKIVQGNIWMSSNAQGHVQVMTLILRIQKESSFRKHMFEYRNPLEQPISITMFRSLRVLLADNNNKKTLNEVNSLVIRFCINWFSVPECSRSCTNNLSSCQLGSSNARNGWICEVALGVHKFCSRCWLLIIAPTASSEEQVGIDGLTRKHVLLHGLADELQRLLQRGAW